jgi:hypothetical protein
MSPKKQAGTPPSPPRIERSPWYSVSVVAKSAACAAAKSLAAKRFLSREAPRLPLPSCDSPDRCGCTYKHHKDRRAAFRREEDNVGIRRPAREERRRTRGRRNSDI